MLGIAVGSLYTATMQATSQTGRQANNLQGVCAPQRPRTHRALLQPLCAGKEVTLLDYGAGNVRSVRNAIKKLGYTIKDVSGHRPPSRAASLTSQRSAGCLKSLLKFVLHCSEAEVDLS